MTKRFCKECGNEFSHIPKFCKECGAPAPGANASEKRVSAGVSIELAISGMVCHSCEATIERALSTLGGVIDKKISYKDCKASIVFDPTKVSEKKILDAIGSKGYKASIIDEGYGRRQFTKNIAVLGILAAIIVVVISVSNSIGFDPGVLSGASLGVVFVFGLITGFHCLGMCGGFVVSYSTKLGGKYNPMPHLAYNVGRIITYSALGLAVGFLGSLVTMSYRTQGLLIILASVVMVLLGLNLLGVFTLTRKIRLGSNPLAAVVSRATRGARGPLVLGLLNGLVPCGMVYIILFTYVPFSSGALNGAMAMAVFGIGTLPLMFLYGSAIAKLSGLLSRNFVKYSGVIVLVLAIVMLNRGLALSNIQEVKPPIATNQAPAANTNYVVYQEITMRIVGNEFVPNKFVVNAGTPVKWTIVGEQVTGCSNEIIQSDWGIYVKVNTGETRSVTFTPTKPGKYSFSCWMAMIFGEIRVV